MNAITTTHPCTNRGGYPEIIRLERELPAGRVTVWRRYEYGTWAFCGSTDGRRSDAEVLDQFAFTPTEDPR